MFKGWVKLWNKTTSFFKIEKGSMPNVPITTSELQQLCFEVYKHKTNFLIFEQLKSQLLPEINLFLGLEFANNFLFYLYKFFIGLYNPYR